MSSALLGRRDLLFVKNQQNDQIYRDDGASRITNDIKQVTGRDPERFAHYARHCAALHKPA
jgi:hypothetical protein